MLDAKKIKSASIWSILETLSASLLGIFSILFLAKLLEPEDYGKIATAQFISGLLQIILSLGLNELIIQKKNLSTNHIQTFWSITIILSIISFIICLIISFILSENNQIIISKILIFEGFICFFSILSIVPTAILMKNLNIKSFALRNIFSRVIFFAFAIPLAFKGFGLWSVVYANFIQILTSFSLIYLETRKILPNKINIDKNIIKKEMSFGYYIMIENFLWSFLSKILGLLIVFFHGTHALGLYNMATKLTDTVVGILNTAITRLALPIFSINQDDKIKLLKVFQASTYYFNMLSMPVFVFMALTASNWVPLLLGDKWKEIIPLIQIISVMYAVMNTRLFVGIAVKAIGRSKEFLKLSLLSAFITISCLLLTKNINLVYAIIILVLCRIIITIPFGVNLMRKICNYKVVDQFKPILKPVVVTFLITVVLVILDLFLKINNEILFVLHIIEAGSIYLVFCFILFKNKTLKWK